MQPFDWLFFDIGSTLVDERKAYDHRIRDMIAGTDLTFAQVDARRREFARQGLDGNSQIISHFQLQKTPWHSEDETLYADAKPLLEWLRERGFRLGVLANQAPGLEQRLEGWGIAGYFSLIVSSAEVGSAKPDPVIFEKALAMAGCQPHRAVMVGDRLDNDIFPAKACGMQTIWLRRGLAELQSAGQAQGQADAVIDSLEQLRALLTPEIRRLNTYRDDRFSQRVLDQHGAFLLNGQPIGFDIIGSDTAVVYGEPGAFLPDILAEFRFYTRHICRFLDRQDNVLREFPPEKCFWVEVSAIQPSQFFVDESKLKAVARAIGGAEDVVIPLLEWQGRWVSLDGHTRLALACQQGHDRVRGYLSPDADREETLAFVEEAQKRGVYTPRDMRLLPHEQYEEQWIGFCDEFFREKQAGVIDLTPNLTGTILDIGGGGEGVIGRRYGRQVTAIDNRQEELEEAPDGFEKRLMDARALAFPDGSFDQVTFFYSLMFMGEDTRRQALAEAARVVRPGGGLHLWDAVIPEDAPQPFLTVVTARLPDETISTTYGVGGEIPPMSAENLQAFCEKIGLKTAKKQVENGHFYLWFEKV